MDAIRDYENAWASLAAARGAGAENEAAARRDVESAAFVHACRGAGIEAPAELAGERAVDSGTEQEKLARDAAPLAPDELGRLHESLAALRLNPVGPNRFRAARCAAARKRSGMVYTPECVARYMVEGALAPWADGAGPRVIVDPACGCGVFLLAAWRRLMDVERLFGVDLDPEAVLVARRALWLEAMSARDSSPAGDRLLGLLTSRIVCGDALGGPALDALLGRADVVLGNPPYRRELDAKSLFDRVAATEFGRRWRTARMDLWYFFLHRGLDLLRPGGALSFVVSSYWTSGRGADKLLGRLRDEANVEEIFLLDDLPVFPGIAGRHMILRVRKSPAAGPTTIKRTSGHISDGGLPSPPAPLPKGEGSLLRPTPRAPRPSPHGQLEALLAGRAPLDVFHKTAEQLFRHGRLDLEPPCDELLERLARFPRLGQLGRVRQGIVENPAQVTRKMNLRHGGRWRVGEGVFALTAEELECLGLSDRERAVIRPYHDLCDLGRNYLAERPSRWLIYSTPETCPDIEVLPAIRGHLACFRPLLEARREVRQGSRAWWHLHWPREEAIWRAAKVIALQMARRPSFAPASSPVYVPFSVNVFVPGPDRPEHVAYFAAVLNSRLLETWFRHHAKRRGVGLEINGGVLARAPIRTIDFADPADRARHERIVELARAPADGEIDQLVRGLYGLGGTRAGGSR